MMNQSRRQNTTIATSPSFRPKMFLHNRETCPPGDFNKSLLMRTKIKRAEVPENRARVK